MQISIVETGNVSYTDATCLVVPLFSDGDADSTVPGADALGLPSLRERKVFSAKAQQVYFIPTAEAEYAGVLLLGLGEQESFDAEVLRRAAGAASEIFQKQRIDRVILCVASDVPLPVEAFIEGVVLGQYDYVEYKEAPEEPVVQVKELLVAVASGEDNDAMREGCDRARLVSENTNWARDLANCPPNGLTPIDLAGHAEDMAKEVGCACTILDESELAKLGMNAILCVGRGSTNPSRLIVLEYAHPHSTRTLAMVGKGVTFDTGGISIKPGAGMHEMKWDMCGAAAVLGAMKSICELKPKVRVICVVPAAENKTGADAYLPGDIIKTYSGKTVEVHNTDAEGRMLLADALSYTTQTYTPDATVDVATLTGACVVALGHYAAGVMANDDDVLSSLKRAAEASGERVWPMPLWKDYSKLIEGTHADLCNIGPAGEAGMITAGCFLQEFVGEMPWAHLDIAGMAWGAKHIPYWDSHHATGFGVRLLTQWVLDEANSA